jgi:hypothetical protein
MRLYKSLIFFFLLCVINFNLQAGGIPTVGCLRLLSHWLHLVATLNVEVLPSILNLWTRHTAVTQDPPNMDAITSPNQSLRFTMVMPTTYCKSNLNNINYRQNLHNSTFASLLLLEYDNVLHSQYFRTSPDKVKIALH